jgi:hypothetical protein
MSGYAVRVMALVVMLSPLAFVLAAKAFDAKSQVTIVKREHRREMDNVKQELLREKESHARALTRLLYMEGKVAGWKESRWNQAVGVHYQPQRWWEKDELCWIAVIMRSSTNLKNLHAFLGTQLDKLKDCVPGTKKCMMKWYNMSAAVDAYLKKLVKDHGGPLIDRNWSKL